MNSWKLLGFPFNYKKKQFLHIYPKCPWCQYSNFFVSEHYGGVNVLIFIVPEYYGGVNSVLSHVTQREFSIRQIYL
jgi:hypothetical protein